MEVGTLKELNVKPGDVVEDMKDREIGKISDKMRWHGKNGGLQWVSESRERRWRIIFRAADKPQTWGEMTDAEKGALLLAAHEGKVIEYFSPILDRWQDVSRLGPFWRDNTAYRVRPEPVRTRVDLIATCVRVGSVDLVDGRPDPASVEWVNPASVEWVKGV